MVVTATFECGRKMGKEEREREMRDAFEFFPVSKTVRVLSSNKYEGFGWKRGCSFYFNFSLVFFSNF